MSTPNHHNPSKLQSTKPKTTIAATHKGHNPNKLEPPPPKSNHKPTKTHLHPPNHCERGYLVRLDCFLNVGPG